MKIAKITYILVSLFVVSSCIKTAPEEDTKYFRTENEWIYEVMKNNYLFRDAIPRNVNFSEEPVLFFNNLLDKSRDVNKKKTHPYSRIELKENATKASNEGDVTGYGFEFISYVSEIGIVPRVLYVIENSPAHKAGLKRGDYIYKINNNSLSTSSLHDLYSGSKKTLLVSETTSSATREIMLEGAEPIHNKPLYMYKTFHSGGRNVAYVVYNHFTPGVGNDPSKDRRYDDELCAMSNELAAVGVNEMVLDLRYNGGGHIDCAQILSTIIAPKSALNKVFCTIVDVNGAKEDYLFDLNNIRNGSNLNLKRLFVLTTEATASASELMINCLRPYMEVVVIGDVTEGKNVGSRDFKHVDFDHILKPLICYVYNREGKADYRNGLIPNHFYRDFDHLEKQFALGDTREVLLKIAIGIINNVPQTKTTKTISTKAYQYSFTPIKSGIEITPN